MRTKASRLGDAGGGSGCVFRQDDMEVELGGFSIRVLTREALITTKKAMGRPKNLLTVAQWRLLGSLRIGDWDGRRAAVWVVTFRDSIWR